MRNALPLLAAVMFSLSADAQTGNVNPRTRT